MLMPTTISTANARKHFADIVNEVVYGRNSVILTRRGEKIAALVPIEDHELLQRLEDVMDIEEARKALAEPGDNIPAKDFWEKLGL